jgi:hypothetical protein
MPGLKDLIAGLKPEKEAKEPKNQRKYVQFTLDEWKAMEAGAGGALETSDVKALIQGIFAGKVNLVAGKK